MFDLQSLDNLNSDYQIAKLGSELRDLAGFWIKEEHWPLLAKELQDDYYLERPIRPESPGACWFIFVLKKEHSNLESGIVLPLQWFREPPTECRLPGSVEVLAEEVLAFARESELIGQRDDYRLGFPDGRDCPDLSQLDKEMEVGSSSGFTPLLTGLRQLVKGDLPSTKVWSTGKYTKKSGISSVGGIKTKIETAKRWGAECLFVPESNKTDEHTSYANELGVELKSLPVRSPSELMGSLGSLFAASLSRPDMAKYHGKPVKDAIQYAAEFHINLAELDRAAAKQWYISSILPLLPAMCEEKLARSNITESPTHLITVASPNPETIRTTVATFGITDCLILHTPEPDMKKHAKKALEYCNELQMNGSRCKASLVPININVDVTDQEQYRRQLSKNFLKAVEHFIRPCPPEYLAIDLTPGFFTIKVVLMEAIAQEKNILIYMRHKWTKVSGIVDHGSEEFVVWRKGDAWRPE